MTVMGESRVWHPGPPPHVGWWNASTQCLYDRWRWWDGTAWSRSAFQQNSPAVAALHAQLHDHHNMQAGMHWNDYWPIDGRVQRRNPETGEITGRTAWGSS